MSQPCRDRAINVGHPALQGIGPHLHCIKIAPLASAYSPASSRSTPGPHDAAAPPTNSSAQPGGDRMSRASWAAFLTFRKMAWVWLTFELESADEVAVYSIGETSQVTPYLPLQGHADTAHQAL